MPSLTRLYTGADHCSHFIEDAIDFELSIPKWSIWTSKAHPIEKGEWVFWQVLQPTKLEWVNPPSRQLFFYLSGHIEITISSGETRSFHSGELLLAEDITGKGHITNIPNSLVALVLKY